ncbi:hypothetical protein FRX31_016846 [Thalictrum thalictroides]|uniref:Uncharacterized protein n=1 Tax=Thalictrum thalictroides TaxID=46969 RepID=A0A7J6W9F0_THATH|nr:hypothetical protein FRX31_016846 [Thalictrum thalictroides]
MKAYSYTSSKHQDNENCGGSNSWPGIQVVRPFRKLLLTEDAKSYCADLRSLSCHSKACLEDNLISFAGLL